jgi:4-diphosphocytidyl-2-C-methyl-D-erythritol kinase
LQPVAERLCPRVAQGIGLLAQAGLKGRMTGSGSAVFAPASDESVDLKTPAGWQVRWCGSLDVHPLRGWASDND